MLKQQEACEGSLEGTQEKIKIHSEYNVSDLEEVGAKKPATRRFSGALAGTPSQEHRQYFSKQ